MKKARAYCKQPNDCVAGRGGPCPLCHDTSKASARMRALRANPEVTEKRLKNLRTTMRAFNWSPAKRAASAAAMRKRNADPVFRAMLNQKCAEARARRASLAKSGLNGSEKRRPIRPDWCPVEYRDLRDELKRKHFRMTEVRRMVEDQIAHDATREASK